MEPLIFRCHHCPRVTVSTDTIARHRGWRLFKGLSITGRQLDDVVCPGCSDRGVNPDPDPISWDVRCDSCKWWFTDTWIRKGIYIIFTQEEAVKIAMDHLDICEVGVVFVRDPDQGRWSYAVDERF